MPIENFGEKANTNGFDKRKEAINRKGAPISFKKQYRKLLEDDTGGLMWIDEANVETREKEQGGKEYGFKLSRAVTLLTRLDQLATGKNDRVALDAIKFLWEQIDGKASQDITQRFDVSKLTDDQVKMLYNQIVNENFKDE